MKAQISFIILSLAVFLSSCSFSSPASSAGEKLLISARQYDLLSILLGKTEIYQIFLDGRGQVGEKSPWKLPIEPFWSPNGQWVAYVTGNSTSTYSDIFIATIDGSYTQKINTYHKDTQGSGSPSWSSDGAQIAYASYNTENSQHLISKIYTVEISCILQHEPCQFNSKYIGDGLDPKWSPLGNTIIYFNQCEDDFHNCIFASNADGSGEPVRLSPLSPSCNSYEWSPDGTKILAHCYDPNYPDCCDKYADGIYIMNADGTNLKLLIKNGYEAKWSPDGSYIVVVIRDYKNAVSVSDTITYASLLYRIDPNGNNLISLRNHQNEVINWFTWYPASLGK
jgi:Tol biopolymer transport system component